MRVITPREENEVFVHCYFEPIKNKFYFSTTNEGDEVEFLPLADDGEYVTSWFFRDKWEGSARFYYVGEL